MLALSIRQPWAELILRGVKTVEYRSRPTRVIGRRFHIYAAGRWPPPADPRSAGRRRIEQAMSVWSRDLAMPGNGDSPPAWMMEMMAELIGRRDLPTGVIVGSALIERVSPAIPATSAPAMPFISSDLELVEDAGSLSQSFGPGLYRWHLADVRRETQLRKPCAQPQPVWFEPFPLTD